MKVYLESLGCRLNAAEIEVLARRFVKAGCDIVNEIEEAEVLVLNTCAVTAQAVRKSRHRLHTMHRRNPQAHIAALGCWATEDAKTVSEIPGVTWTLPNADKELAIERITGKATDPAIWLPGRCGHTRVFLGVQEGCDSKCTYCITRILRGPAHSIPLPDVVTSVQNLVAQGAQEVVLTGVSLGAYGHDLGMQSGLASLVAAILKETDLPRLRLSSVEPWDVDEPLLQHLSDSRFCRQLHLPLQAGSDSTLRKMGRTITTQAFAQLVARARAISPEVAITTDIITGFPGETETQFSESLAFVETMKFAKLHVFPYSEREGTPAIRLPGRIPKSVRKARAKQMRTLGEKMAISYRKRFTGKTLPVLWESQDGDGYWHGLTDTYLQVLAKAEENLYNRITRTRLNIVKGKQFLGDIIPDSPEQPSQNTHALED